MIPKIRELVVGAALGSNPDPVLKPAMELATRHRATLHVVHGYMLNDPLLDAYVRSGHLGEDKLAGHGGELQRRLEDQIAALGDDENVRVHAFPAAPVTAMLDVADVVGADLVIVGATHRDRLPGSLLGSTCRAVLRRSHLPVLMLKAASRALPDRILAPTDLGRASASAYGWAISLAMGTSRPVEVRSLLVISEALMVLPLEQRLLTRVAEEELAEFTRGVVVAGESLQHVIRRGDPAQEIVAEAAEWGADLIVLGTQGRRGMERLLLGSVAEATLKSAPCDVLLVPQQLAPSGDESPIDLQVG